MSIVNLLSCGFGKNTGVDDCDIELANTAGAFLAGPGFSIPVASLVDAATFIAYLKTAALATDPAQRVYPIHNLVQIGGAAEGSVIENFNDGSKGKVRSGFFDAIYRMKIGGSCLWQKVADFDGKAVSILRYDANGVSIGATNAAGDLVFVNLSLFDVQTPNENDGTKTTERAFHINANPSFYKNIGLVPAQLQDLLSVKGLQTIYLVQNGARALGVVKVNMYLGCSKKNLYTNFAAAIAAGGIVLAKDANTGNAVPVLSVVANATIFGFTVTVDTTNGNYNPGNKLIIYMDTPTAINTAVPAIFAEGLPLTTLT